MNNTKLSAIRNAVYTVAIVLTATVFLSMVATITMVITSIVVNAIIGA